jgi:hypothetical protein
MSMQTSGISCREKADPYPTLLKSSEGFALHERSRATMRCPTSGMACRSAILVEGLRPTACRGMFDGMVEGFTPFWIGRHV